jgi:hypothetical protein
MLQKWEQAPKRGSNEEEKKIFLDEKRAAQCILFKWSYRAQKSLRLKLFSTS